MAEVFAAMKSLGMVRSPAYAIPTARPAPALHTRPRRGWTLLLQDWKVADSVYHVYGRYRHPSNRYVRSIPPRHPYTSSVRRTCF